MNRRTALLRNLDNILNTNPAIRPTLAKLQSADIRYGLYAGAHVAALVRGRTPNDFDLIVHDDDLGKLRSAFPRSTFYDRDNGVYLFIGRNKKIEIVSKGMIVVGGNNFPFRLSDLAHQRCTHYVINGTYVVLMDIADTLILKSLLRRGAEQHKHDMEDMRTVISRYGVDRDYLQRRLEEMEALSQARSAWLQFGIIF